MNPKSSNKLSFSKTSAMIKCEKEFNLSISDQQLVKAVMNNIF